MSEHVLLHLGYHKTGSTALQEQLFAKEETGYALPDEPRIDLIDRFVLPGPFEFDSAAVRAHYAPFLERTRKSGRTAVLSHERFSGYPPSGGFDAPLLASRLHETFPEARILIVVREQLSSIASMYLQYITDGGDRRLKDYLSPHGRYLKRSPGFSPCFYRYDRLVTHYRRLFGEDRVLVVAHETLIGDPQSVVDAISTFCGQTPRPFRFARQNESRPASFQAIQRLVNRYIAPTEFNRTALIPHAGFAKRFGYLSRYVPRGLTRALDARIMAGIRYRVSQSFEGEFAASNRRLARMTGLDLAALGYQTSESQPVRSPDPLSVAA